MLESTFCHIPGIGGKTEQLLWDAGIRSWDDFCSSLADELPVSAGKAELIARHLEESRERLAESDYRYFYDSLPPRHHWRLFPRFRQRTAYLDIETTGLGNPGDYITTIAIYDGRTIQYYIKDENLDEFPGDIEQFDVVVTYNGKSFDVPFIRRYLRIPMKHAHIDLMHVLRSLGYRGGLKGCEHQLGIDRGDLEGVDGFFAVLLWYDYLEKGNASALETLLAYNIQDVVNLDTLMVMAYNMKLKETPWARGFELPMPEEPELPFAADPETVARIGAQYYGI